MQVLAIANQKGGTGKTTTAHTIGAMLALRTIRVLLIDLDPQASLTTWAGIDAAGASLAEVLGDAKPGKLKLPDIIKTISPGLDLAPSDIALSSSELGLVSRMGRETVLKRALASVAGYDIAIIDCPPALGVLTVNGLTAANAVIAPVLPAAADLRGLLLFLNTIAEIRQDLNPALQLLGVLVVQFDGRLNAHNQALESIQAAKLPLLPVVPRSVRVQEAAAVGQPLPDYDPTGKPAAAFNLVSIEVEKWLENQ